MVTYPTTLPCAKVNGATAKQESSKKYLGDNSYHIPYPTVSVTLVAETKADLIALADFYYNDINGGTDLFLATWMFEGVTDYAWTVRIVGGFDTSYLFSTVGEKKITVEILDDVAAVIASKNI